MQWWQLFALFAVVSAQTAHCWHTPDDHTTSTRWRCPLHRIGMTPECPAMSCKQILEFNPFVNNGKYWLWVTSEEVVFPAFCDMKSGGYMLTIYIPKGFCPEIRKSNDVKEMVMKPQTMIEIMDSLWDMNEGHLDWVMHPRTIMMPMAYKNRMWRYWDRMNFERVRIQLKKDGKIAKVLEFKVNGADSMGWFKVENMVDVPGMPSWMDMTPSKVNMWWKTGSTSLRNWMVFNRASTCTDTWGWMMGVNNINAITSRANPAPCPWESMQPCLSVMYSKGSNMANFSNADHIEVADAISIMVR